MFRMPPLPLLCLILWCAAGCVSGCARYVPVTEPDTREFVRDFPKWERVRDAERAAPSFTALGLAGADAAKNRAWLRLASEAAALPLREKLARINAFFNQWPYTEDVGEDYWMTPREFAARSGDCEDYAIAKYYALRYLGVPAGQLRVVAVWNRRRGEGHALLAVIADGKAQLLDCRTDPLLTWQSAPYYQPVFSVNETYLWRYPLQR